MNVPPPPESTYMQLLSELLHLLRNVFLISSDLQSDARWHCRERRRPCWTQNH